MTQSELLAALQAVRKHAGKETESALRLHIAALVALVPDPRERDAWKQSPLSDDDFMNQVYGVALEYLAQCAIAHGIPPEQWPKWIQEAADGE